MVAKHLLSGIEPLIQRARRVFVIPDGPLHVLPFGALVLDQGGSTETDLVGAPLGVARALEIIPSVTVLDELRSSSPRTRSSSRDRRSAHFGQPAVDIRRVTVLDSL